MTDTTAPTAATVGWTEVNVALPLPLDVASTLMRLIGAAYPSTMIDMTGKGGRYGLTLKIDPAERAVDVTDEQARAVVLDSQPELLSFDASSFSTSTPDELRLFLGELAHAIFTATDGAINYIEWEIRTPDDDTYVLTISKSKRQRPTALLEQANAEAALLRASLDELAAMHRPHLPQPYGAPCPTCWVTHPCATFRAIEAGAS